MTRSGTAKLRSAARANKHRRQLDQFPPSTSLRNMLFLLVLTSVASADLTLNEVQYLNELPIEKLLRLKTSLQDLVINYDNVTTTPAYQNFGAQALALNAPPIKRTDYESSIHKKGSSKLSNLFSMSITTLAFLAFGGYLLCLIVQAVKAKETYYNNQATPAPAFFLNAGIKKKPHLSTQLTSYGRRKRAIKELDLPPEQMFDALLRLCEGYVRWNQKHDRR